MEKNNAANTLHVGSFSAETVLFKTNLVLDTFHEKNNQSPFCIS